MATQLDQQKNQEDLTSTMAPDNGFAKVNRALNQAQSQSPEAQANIQNKIGFFGGVFKNAAESQKNATKGLAAPVKVTSAPTTGAPPKEATTTRGDTNTTITLAGAPKLEDAWATNRPVSIQIHTLEAAITDPALMNGIVQGDAAAKTKLADLQSKLKAELDKLEPTSSNQAWQAYTDKFNKYIADMQAQTKTQIGNLQNEANKFQIAGVDQTNPFLQGAQNLQQASTVSPQGVLTQLYGQDAGALGGYGGLTGVVAQATPNIQQQQAALTSAQDAGIAKKAELLASLKSAGADVDKLLEDLSKTALSADAQKQYKDAWEQIKQTEASGAKKTGKAITEAEKQGSAVQGAMTHAKELQDLIETNFVKTGQAISDWNPSTTDAKSNVFINSDSAVQTALKNTGSTVADPIEAIKHFRDMAANQQYSQTKRDEFTAKAKQIENAVANSWRMSAAQRLSDLDAQWAAALPSGKTIGQEVKDIQDILDKKNLTDAQRAAAKRDLDAVEHFQQVRKALAARANSAENAPVVDYAGDASKAKYEAGQDTPKGPEYNPQNEAAQAAKDHSNQPNALQYRKVALDNGDGRLLYNQQTGKIETVLGDHVVNPSTGEFVRMLDANEQERAARSPIYGTEHGDRYQARLLSIYYDNHPEEAPWYDPYNGYTSLSPDQIYEQYFAPQRRAKSTGNQSNYHPTRSDSYSSGESPAYG